MTTDFELIAITRDLARKPDVLFLAQIMAKVNNPSASRRIEDLPPDLVKLAYKLINNRNSLEMFLSALGTVTDHG